MGFYAIEQAGGAAVSRAFLRDFLDIQAQLNSVEDALNVFGNTSQNTRFRAFNGAAAGDLNLPHFMVDHPVLGPTYLREAINWLRAQKGAPAFGWVSVPSAAEWGTRSWKEGLNRRWINAMRQAIGRIQQTQTGSPQTLKLHLGTVTSTGSITYAPPAVQFTGGSEISITNRVSGNVSYGKKWSKGLSLVNPADDYTVNYPFTYSAPDLDWAWNPTQFEGFVRVFERISGATGTPGVITYDPFEQAYPDFVAVLPFGSSVAAPVDTYTYGEGGFTSTGNQTVQFSLGGRNWTGSNPANPNSGTFTQVDGGGETFNLRDPNESEVGTSRFSGGGVLPQTVEEVLTVGAFTGSKYLWAIPPDGIEDLDLPASPTLAGDASSYKDQIDAWITPQDLPAVERYGSMKASESYHRSARAVAQVFRPRGAAGGNWIFWTEEIIPTDASPAWPNDVYTN